MMNRNEYLEIINGNGTYETIAKGDDIFQLDYSITQYWDCPTGLIKICLPLDHGKIARKDR